MTHRRVFDCVDRSLKDLMRKTDPLNGRRIFGGKVVVFLEAICNFMSPSQGLQQCGPFMSL